MSLKNLFGKTPTKQLSSITKEDLSVEVESENYLDSFVADQDRFVPDVDFSDPKNFAKFGSAERYYVDAIESIYNTYPYDGSKKEKIDWELSSSHLEKYLLKNGYPKTTGYVTFGTSSTTTSKVSGYGVPATQEYIFTKGGPGIGRTGDFSGSNKYDLSNNRENNLRIGNENTVEFWLLKNGFDNASTSYETVFDAWTTGSVSSSADYGRLRIDLCASASASPWRVTWMSGAYGADNYTIGSSLTTGTIADSLWHHYAFRFNNSGSTSTIDLFMDGVYNSSVSFTGPVSYVSGTIVSTIGAINTAPSGVANVSRGYAKLSGSIDEFRFWKNWRTSKEIERNWFDQVGGGTNTDLANTQLGVYYKFNEGIIGDTTYDASILDYSGRVSNGYFYGYGSSSRSTGSAIVISNAAAFETQDPIIYSNHPDVIAYKESLRLTGSQWDQTNGGSLYKTMPAWLMEEQESLDQTNKQRDSLVTLTQIMASHFDTLEQQIAELPKIASAQYMSSSEKSYPFYDKLLRSEGMSLPEIFSDATVYEYFNSRNDDKLFEKNLYEVKNTIYQNLYNNLLSIYKSKGTEKSLRNFLHCFGVNDDVYKLNVYSDNKTYELEDNFSTQALRKKFVNFSVVGNSDASVYQYQDTANSSSVSYITGSRSYAQTYEGSGLSLTAECEVIFPKRYPEGQFNTTISGTSTPINYYPLTLTSSIFGMHTAKASQSDLTWATNDYSNFQVYCVKDSLYSNRGYFLLTCSAGGFIPAITSSYFDDLYDDSKWCFSVTVTPNAYPYESSISGSNGSHIVEFRGINKISDYTNKNFYVTGAIAESDCNKVMTECKRFYVGAHKTNFTGSTIAHSDVKIGSFRVWYTRLTEDELSQHAQDSNNKGIGSPQLSAFTFQSGMTGTFVPRQDTLVLDWDFETVTGSDSSGQFTISDQTSGSAEIAGRYGWYGNVLGKQYTARGDFFNTSSTDCYSKEYLINAKKELPSYNNSSSLVNILAEDDTNFNISKQTNTYRMLLEKSMYGIISSEMMKILDTVKNFNTLWGNPVLRYRQNNHMETLLREHFFQHVLSTPDIEKYYEYFKWFDTAITFALSKLMPATSNLSEEHVRNIIESHILESNRYKYAFSPFKDARNENITSVFQGIGKLDYNYRFGAATSSAVDNCVWQSLRRERATTTAQALLDVITNNSNEPGTIQSGSSGQYSGSVFENKYFNKVHLEKTETDYVAPSNRDYYKSIIAGVTGSENTGLVINLSNTGSTICNDYSDLGRKTKIKNVGTTAVVNSTTIATDVKVLPFKIFSGSSENSTFVEIHRDLYAGFQNEPMQSPFTEKHVGGQQSRHIPINFSGSRPEAFSLIYVSGNYVIASPKGQNSGKNNAFYYRDSVAKRPINVKNIACITSSLYGSSEIGNFSKNYEFIFTTGRTENNRYFVRMEGQLPSSSYSTAISGVMDWAIPVRDVSSSYGNHVIVSRFSFRGSPETDSEGALDSVAGEYSVYNVVPYRDLRTKAFYDFYEAQHCGQFGYDSVIVGDYLSSTMSGTYENSASFQKTNKNRLLRIEESGSNYITASVFDNNFVQNLIPRNDYQYQWISSSFSGTWTGYGQPNLSESSLATTDYPNFTSGSVASTTSAIPLLPLNTAIIGTISADTGSGVVLLDSGSSPLSLTAAEKLYAINLSRNGNAGWSTWKQIGGNKQLNKYFQQNNYMTVLTGTTQVIFVEPILTTKFKNLVFKFKELSDNDSTNTYEVSIPFGNSISKFSNHYDNTINFDQTFGVSTESDAYRTMKVLVADKRFPIENNKFKNIQSLVYSETVYPREQLMGLLSTVTRINYSNIFWRNNRNDRAVTTTGTFGKPVSSSIWPLDARTNFESGLSVTASAQLGTLGEGELQNNYSTFHIGTKSNLNVGPCYTRRAQVSSSTGISYVGDTKWEAGAQSANPFYDSYNEYNEELRRKAKDFTIVPEFRISEHMDFYINQNYGNFLADNTSSYSITGASVQNSSDPTFYKKYTTTEFLKYFDKVKDDFKDRLEPSSLTLKCKGLVKLLPYDGFYPASRTVQLVSLFSQSYGSYITVTGTDSANSASIRPIIQPLFAPGILYNTIKSGLAVDYPIYTQAYSVTGNAANPDNGIARLNSNFDYRVPFEAIIEPETYLKGLPVVDQEPNDQSAMNVTASMVGAGSDLYKLASHNFFAESINFFLKDSTLTTFASLPDSDPQFGNVVNGNKYIMRVVCSHAKYRQNAQYVSLYAESVLNPPGIFASQSYEFNPPTIQMHKVVGSGSSSGSTFNLYGSEFGVPCNYYNSNDPSGFMSSSYFPYTPPYYGGYSHIEITYTATGSGKVSVKDILSAMTVSNTRYDTADFLNSTTARVNSMKLTASVNYQQTAIENNTQFDASGNPISVGTLGQSTKWVIQPKFETPVLDFSNANYTTPASGSEGIAKGMWHQYGTIPRTADKGIFLEIQDYAASEITNTATTGSLADLVGFKKSSQKIGKIAKSQKIKEAIIAVPFYNDLTGKEQYYEIPRETIEYAQLALSGQTDLYNLNISQNPQLKPSPAIIEMVKKMQTYVIPPKFDFLTYTDRKCFAMYIFEFSVDLSQTDLSKIWQNCSPDAALKMSEQQDAVSHNLFQFSEKGTEMLKEVKDIQWLVFKVKQKGSWNYYAKTADTRDDSRFKFNFKNNSGAKEAIPEYSYNWPYDFCSIVELAKIDADIEFTKKEDDNFIGNVEGIQGDPEHIERILDPYKIQPAKGNR